MGSACSCLKKSEGADGANAAPQPSAASSPPPVEEDDPSNRPDETRRRGSVFYSAKESATSSMLYVPSSLPNYLPRGSVAMDDPDSLLRSGKKIAPLRKTMIVKESLDQPTVKLAMRGYPGELTRDELQTCLDFRRSLKEQDDPSYREMVDQFEDVEEEPFALCRFLRGRDFHLDETLKLMDDAVQTWKTGRSNNFYPTVEEAVCCPTPVFMTQFPYIYSGVAKNGCPVAYLRAGDMVVEGIECVTDLDKVACYMWNAFMFQFKKEVKRAQKSNPNAVRCESITVIDLKGLDTSQLNKKTLATLQSVTVIGGCFPELLNRMVILNTPFAFSVFWKIIKQFLTARTVAKIEIFSNEKNGNRRLFELVDKKELLADYGGQGPSSDQLMNEAENKSGCSRQVSKLVSRSGKQVQVTEITPQEKATVRVYSRSTTGARITLLKNGDVVTEVELQKTSNGSTHHASNHGTSNHGDLSETSYCTDIVNDLRGPGRLEVMAESSKSPDFFLVHIEVFTSG